MFSCEEEHHFTFSPRLTAISTAAGQVEKIINRNASLVLFRGPGQMWRRAGYGPRAVVWGPLLMRISGMENGMEWNIFIYIYKYIYIYR